MSKTARSPRAELARGMDRDIREAAEIEGRGRPDEGLELVIAERGELDGGDARVGAREVDASREIALGEGAGGEAEETHQKTP
ncbi:MAG: hypothetical protein U0359_11455 [Byssovorax sp.]